MADIKEILKINADNLKQTQFNALKAYSIGILKRVITYIETEDFEKLEDMLEFSPAGDCMGSENYYIKFDFRERESDYVPFADIQEVISTLKQLQPEVKRRDSK